MKQMVLRRKLHQWKQMGRKVCVEYRRPKRMLTKLKHPEHIEADIHSLKDQYSYIKLCSVDITTGELYNDSLYIIDIY